MEMKPPVKRIGDIGLWCLFDEIVPIDRIVPHPKANNTHPQKQIALLSKIIQISGWRAPITISKRSGYVTKGHGKLLAAAHSQFSAAPVEYQDYADEASELADMSADNRIAELSALDEKMTKALLIDLHAAGFDFELAGFTLSEVEKLIDIGNVGKTDPDQVPDADSVPQRTMLGDLWILGGHRLLCGSATDRKCAARLMEGTEADMVFTDPPYNVNYQGQTKKHLTIKNDHLSADQFFKFITSAMANYYDHTRKGGAIYVCHSDKEWRAFRSGMEQAGWNLKQCLIWEKNQFVLGRHDYHWRHEPILYGSKPGMPHRWYGGRKQDTVINLPDGVSIEKKEDGSAIVTIDIGLQRLVLKSPELEIIFAGDDSLQTIWKVKKPLANEDHPTIKPVELIERALTNSTQAGGIVSDWFGGSGSTLIACERLGRRARIMEFDPIYCDVIVKRWEAYTGKEAIRVAG